MSLIKFTFLILTVPLLLIGCSPKVSLDELNQIQGKYVGARFETQRDAFLFFRANTDSHNPILNRTYLTEKFLSTDNSWWKLIDEVPRNTIIEILSVESESFSMGSCGRGWRVRALLLLEDNQYTGVDLLSNLCLYYGKPWVSSHRPLEFSTEFLKQIK